MKGIWVNISFLCGNASGVRPEFGNDGKPFMLCSLITSIFFKEITIVHHITLSSNNKLFCLERTISLENVKV